MSQFLNNLIVPKETVDGLINQFNQIAQKPQREIAAALAQEINKKIECLHSEFEDVINGAKQELTRVKEQIDFLKEKIAEEGKGANSVFKRFTTRAELYDFERELKNFKVNHCIKNPITRVDEQHEEEHAADETKKY
ncbi:MAG: hypothetical protein PSV35_01355, partial [bacterium]|nr:hypothetical protein [bacterium]